MNKLFELQKALKPIKKDSVNPHFKNSYFDINSVLEVVMPILNDLGITLHQPIIVQGDKNVISTILADEGKTLIQSHIVLPDLQDPQKLGSAITYYRRYSLVSLLALEAEDDDGNTASGVVQKQATQDFESQGLVRFNAPFIEDKVKFKALTDYLKENGGKFDMPNKCWWVTAETAEVLKKKFNPTK